MNRPIETGKTRKNGVPMEELQDDPSPTPATDTGVDLGQILGSESGDERADELEAPSGWTGTDDATSTAPSDLPIEMQREHDPLAHRGGSSPYTREDFDPSARADGGELEAAEGGVADITGSPVEGHHDLTSGPEIARGDSF